MIALAVLAALLVVGAVLVAPRRAPVSEVLIGGVGDEQPVEGLTAARLRSRLRGRADADRDAQEEALLGLLSRLVPALRAGLPSGQALQVVTRELPAERGPQRELGEHARSLSARAAAGYPVGTDWATGLPDWPSLAALGRAWVLSEQLGTPLAASLESAAADLRRSARARAHSRSMTAGARATMQVLTLLPLTGLLVMPLVGVSPAAAFPPAVLLLAVLPGAALILLGRRLTRRLINRALRPRDVG